MYSLFIDYIFFKKFNCIIKVKNIDFSLFINMSRNDNIRKIIKYINITMLRKKF